MSPTGSGPAGPVGPQSGLSGGKAAQLGQQPEPAGPESAAARQPGLRARYRGAGSRTRLAIVTAVVVIGVVVGLALADSLGGGSAPLPAASNFSVPVLGSPGQRLSLSGFAGKPVIVNFFASWCTPCQRETPLLASFYRGAHGRVAIVGIDVNDPAGPAQAFIRKTGVSYPIGVDAPPMPTAGAYDVNGLPQTFFLNAQHLVVKRVFGAVTRQQLATGTALMQGK